MFVFVAVVVCSDWRAWPKVVVVFVVVVNVVVMFLLLLLLLFCFAADVGVVVFF